MKTVILVATHKEYSMPKDSLYLPIQAGKEISETKLAFMGDNTGEHISAKNKSYCELTAVYWAWKNIEADAVGLVHYRRYFGTKKAAFVKDKYSQLLTAAEADALLNKYDVLLPKKRNYWIETNYSQYIHAHPKEGLDKTKEILHRLYPEYDAAWDEVMNETKSHRFNMFVMKKDIFDAYCGWLFSILEQLELELDTSEYDAYNRRVFGFIGERLLDVYVRKQGLAYKELPVVFMEKQHWLKKGTAFLKRKFFYKEHKN